MNQLVWYQHVLQILQKTEYSAAADINMNILIGHDKPGEDHDIFHTGENVLDYILPKYHQTFLKMKELPSGLYSFEYEFKHHSEILKVQSVFKKDDDKLLVKGQYI